VLFGGPSLEASDKKKNGDPAEAKSPFFVTKRS